MVRQLAIRMADDGHSVRKLTGGPHVPKRAFLIHQIRNKFSISLDLGPVIPVFLVNLIWFYPIPA
jgi:hypothetical protein